MGSNKKNKNRLTMQRWDAVEDAIVIANLQKYPTNFKLAFQQSAIETGRSESSVSQRYYSKLKHGEAIIAVGSEQGIIPNTKVTVFKGDNDTDTRKSMLVAMFGSMDPTLVVETFLGLLTMEEQKSLFKRATTKLAS